MAFEVKDSNFLYGVLKEAQFNYQSSGEISREETLA